MVGPRWRRFLDTPVDSRRLPSWLAPSIALALLGLLLTLPAPGLDGFGRFDGASTAGATLKGAGLRSDFAADYVGARALTHRESPYPLLGPAFKDVGLDWPLTFHSTHPPSAEVLALPLAGFSWPVASAIWAWLMALALALSIWAFGVPLRWAPAVALLGLLVWPPAAWSLGQLMPLWLLGAALAWRWRDRPGLAGAAVGLAAATKVFPALLLAPFLLRRQWRALAGFLAVEGALFGIAVALYPHAIARFLEIASTEGEQQRSRLDNGSLLMAAYNHGGTTVVLGAVLLIVLVVVTAIDLKPHTPLSFATFGKWLWLTLALLPLAWIYSLLVLAPLLIFALRSRSPIAVLTASAAAVLPAVGLPFLVTSAPQLALSIALAGLSMLAASSATSARATVTTTRAPVIAD
jgi:Glycosyltransferase family 87